MRARVAVARGWRELLRAPAPTLAAVLGTIAGALAARAALLRSAQAIAAARPGRAALTWLVGMSVAALVVDVTRAAALVAYGGPRRPLGQTLALGLVRTPGMISVRAVELTIYFALGLGALFVGAVAPQHAWPLALALLPAAALALAAFAASRVAQVVIARGLPPAVALAHGYDVVIRRLPSLVRLALLGGLATAPFFVVAAFMPFPLGSALVGIAALWLYAALAAVVGSDARLATG
jgi:hypothetical protein